MTRMMNVTPFLADANLGDADAPEIRRVQVIGMTQADDWTRPAWVAIETIDGWEHPRIVDAVRWVDKPTGAQA